MSRLFRRAAKQYVTYVTLHTYKIRCRFASSLVNLRYDTTRAYTSCFTVWTLRAVPTQAKLNGFKTPTKSRLPEKMFFWAVEITGRSSRAAVHIENLIYSARVAVSRIS